MNILLVALGLGPFVQRPENAQFVTGLSKALCQLGHEVTIMVPYLPAYANAGLLLGRRLSAVPLKNGQKALVYDVSLASGANLVLVRGETDFDPDQPLGVQAGPLGIFALAVAELVAFNEQADEPFEVVHAHGASAGLCLLHLSSTGGGGTTRVLSVHDAAESGDFATTELDVLGIPGERQGAHYFGSGDGLCLLKGLLPEADAVIAPSDAYSRALQAPERHGALARAFRAVSPLGVLCGVDLAVFNPSTDAALTCRYDAPDPSNKARNKSALLSELRLEFELGRPLLFVEDVPQGDGAFQTVLSALPGIVRNGVTLVLALPGPLASEFAQVAEALADRVRVVPIPDAAKRRRFLAAADFYLSVRRHDPFGQELLQAARYGAIPIAYLTDAVADIVVDCDAELKTGTGLLYETMTQRSLVAVSGRAFAAYQDAAYLTLLRRVMRQDFAWDRSARRHVQIYRQSAQY